jgi:hypothetical protein
MSARGLLLSFMNPASTIHPVLVEADCTLYQALVKSLLFCGVTTRLCMSSRMARIKSKGRPLGADSGPIIPHQFWNIRTFVSAAHRDQQLRLRRQLLRQLWLGIAQIDANLPHDCQLFVAISRCHPNTLKLTAAMRDAALQKESSSLGGVAGIWQADDSGWLLSAARQA